MKASIPHRIRLLKTLKTAVTRDIARGGALRFEPLANLLSDEFNLTCQRDVSLILVAFPLGFSFPSSNLLFFVVPSEVCWPPSWDCVRPG